MRRSIKTITYILISLAVLFSATGCQNNKKKQNMEEQNNTPLFPKGNKLPNEWFTGDAYLHPMLPRDKNNAYVIGNVTFEPGARTNWHTHPKGQVLIVVEGSGIYQVKGKPAQLITKGDVVNIPEDTEHWHGATAKDKMAHIAITNYLGDENATWLLPVTDEEFASANNDIENQSSAAR